MKPLRILSARPSRRGLTFVEFLVVVAIFSMIGLMASGLFLLVARQTLRSLNSIPPEADGFRLMNQIRERLMGASPDSIYISDTGQVITFADPTLPAPSQIAFDPNSGDCYYVANTKVNQGAVNWGDATDVRFEALQRGRRIIVSVSTPLQDRRNKELVTTRQETLTLRN